ncbi:MAG: tetratricopeptide repeat protein [Sedimentisphaerales bacterium]
MSTLLVFWQVRNFDFVHYDDNGYVYENQHVLNGLTPDGIIWAFTTCHLGYWQPLTWLSLMLNCQLFGTNSGWFHLVNVFLHLANTLLLFAVFKKMTSALWPSAFVAAAFALHPMHVESVVWIAERKDVLSTLFLLLTLAAYVSYVRRRGLVRYVLTVLLFASGLLAKPMLVTLPFLLLLLDYWPLNRFGSQPAKTSGRQPRKLTPIHDGRAILYRIIIEKIPFFVLSAVSSVITFLTQQARGGILDIKSLPLKERVDNVFLSYAAYMGKMFWPENLAVFYPFDPDSFPLWQVVLCALLLVGVSFLVFRIWHTRKYLLVGWLWFVGTLIPVIGLVQFTGSSYADRFTYIPYIGLFTMIVWGLPELLSKWLYRKIALGIAAAMVLTAMGMGTYRQVGYWKNSSTLFTHALEATKNNYLAHNNLGVTYYKLGRYQDAIESYKQAIRINPDYADAHNNLGVAYGDLGRYQDAIEAYKRAIRINPDYADAHCNLGSAYDKLGRNQDAIESYKQAIRIKPDYADAHYNLGAVYSKLGRWQDAIEAYKQAIRIKPNLAEAYCNLGFTYSNLGRYQEEIESYRQAIRIKPDYADAHYNLGVVYGSLGRYQDAVEALKQAIRIKPNWTEAHYNLGVTYLITGNKESALEEYKILKTLDTEQANKLFHLINK